MEGNTLVTDSMFIKKDIFIKTRKDDIRLFYEFNPKVFFHLIRFLAEELMESSIRHVSKNLPTQTESSNSSPRKW